MANLLGQDLSIDLSTEPAFRLDFRCVSAPLSLTASVITAHGGGTFRRLAGFALDTFSTTPAVPEPVSAALLLAGLGRMAVARHQRRRH